MLHTWLLRKLRSFIPTIGSGSASRGGSCVNLINLSANSKHLIHCCLFLLVIIIFEFLSGGLTIFTDTDNPAPDPYEAYGWAMASFLYLLRFLALLALPQCICNCLGLVIYNAFPDKVQLKGSPLLAPFISIRTVTRGDFPDLVKDNVNRNMNTCLAVGLENFIIEVVTDKPIGFAKHPRIRELVVPSEYKTKTGALFKVVVIVLLICVDCANSISIYFVRDRRGRYNSVWRMRTTC